jgi:hypothetical protein
MDCVRLERVHRAVGILPEPEETRTPDIGTKVYDTPYLAGRLSRVGVIAYAEYAARSSVILGGEWPQEDTQAILQAKFEPDWQT